jgi:hypothetical protein
MAQCSPSGDVTFETTPDGNAPGCMTSAGGRLSPGVGDAPAAATLDATLTALVTKPASRIGALVGGLVTISWRRLG